ncbi:unnamed protein product [Ilex paraguariensis]|uniref:Uncharacterized protein n=1 Tax=Ilex paraguariensis TaxID=185542 RepID=A0ABC8V5D5_9AQUA
MAPWAWNSIESDSDNTRRPMSFNFPAVLQSRGTSGVCEWTKQQSNCEMSVSFSIMLLKKVVQRGNNDRAANRATAASYRLVPYFNWTYGRTGSIEKVGPFKGFVRKNTPSFLRMLAWALGPSE